MSTRHQQGKRRWAHFSLVIGSLTLTLAMLEVGLRLFGAHGVMYIELDDVLGYRYMAGAPYRYIAWDGCPGWKSEGRVNSLGLRDFEYDYTKPKSTYRILALGDSFTVGMEHPIEYIWPKLLEQMLNQRQESMRYEVINVGRQDVGTTYEYLYYVTEGYRYEPDLVILLVIGNDVTDNSQFLRTQYGSALTYYPFYTVENDQLLLDNSFKDVPSYRLRKVTTSLRQRSALINYLHYVSPPIRRWLSGLLRVSVKPAEAAQFNEPSHDRVEAFETEYANSVTVTQHMIVELAQAVEDSDARLAMFNGTGDFIWNDPVQPGTLLAEVAASEGILYKDLAPLLEDYAVHTSEYVSGCVENDGVGHWSRVGHIQAATLMNEFLLESGVLP